MYSRLYITLKDNFILNMKLQLEIMLKVFVPNACSYMKTVLM